MRSHFTQGIAVFKSEPGGVNALCAFAYRKSDRVSEGRGDRALVVTSARRVGDRAWAVSLVMRARISEGFFGSLLAVILVR